MSKIAKSMAVLGVVAGLGVAALPLSSYAAEVGSATSGDVNIKVTVNTSLAVASSESDIDLGTINAGTPVRTGTTDVTVSGSAQMNWELRIEDKDDNNNLTLTDEDGAILSGAVTNQLIPAGAPSKGTSAWGYKGGTVTDFEAVPVKGSGKVFASGAFDNTVTTAKPGTETTTVTFGVSAGTGLAEGVYKDTVVFIAAPKA